MAASGQIGAHVEGVGFVAGELSLSNPRRRMKRRA
jgi:hypothetical protein